MSINVFLVLFVLLMIGTVAIPCLLRAKVKAEFAGNGTFNYKPMPRKRCDQSPLEFVERLS